MNDPCEKCIERDYCQTKLPCKRHDAYLRWKEKCKEIREHTLEVMERERKKMTFEELEKEVSRKLMEQEMSPEEFVKRYNEMIKEDSKKHVEPMEPHEHI